MTKRTEAWGDDPAERDADATLAELPVEAGAVERPWYDHVVIFPLKVVARFLARNGKRIAVAIAGGFLILVGIVLLVLPGPGWLFIFLGLGVLATEFVWAERMLNIAKEKAKQAKDKVMGKKEARAAKKAHKRARGEGPGPDTPATEAPANPEA
jgi:uncharacterized protein (TIGR02611 family)